MNCHEPVKGSEFNAVVRLVHCITHCAMRRQDFERIDALGADYNAITEKLFVFALTWSFGKRFVPRSLLYCSVQCIVFECLAILDKFLSTRYRSTAVFPAANTVLDSFVDMSKNDLIGWDAKGPSWRAVQSMTLHDMIGTSLLFPY